MMSVFYRDYYDDDGLFIRVCATESGENNGPFTVDEARRRDDWAKFEEAIEQELATCKERQTWKLVDKTEAENTGAYIYPTRFVLVRKRSGKYKARFVVRGDYQVFDEFDDYDDAVYEQDHSERSDEDGQNDHDDDVALNAMISGDSGSVEPSVDLDADEEFDVRDERDRSDSESDDDLHDDLRDEVWRGKKGDFFRANILNANMKHQVRHIYRQLFSPVVNSSVLFVMLAVAVANGEHLYAADVTGAFLYAPLLPEEVVFCYPPKGFEHHEAFAGKIMKLEKALYGLRQAPRRWWQELCKLFEKHELKRTRIDPCLFTLRKTSSADSKDNFYIKAGVHVDDMLFATNNSLRFTEWFDGVKKDIHFSEYLKISTSPTDFVSLEMTYHMGQRWLTFSQRKYITVALERANLSDAKSIETPFQSGIKFTKEDMPDVPDARRVATYRKLLGIANWVVRSTCPEGMYAISHLSEFMSNPSESMLTQLVRVFRYFKFTIEHDCDTLKFKVGWQHHRIFGQGGTLGRNQLYGYVDATFSAKGNDRYTELWFLNGMLVDRRTSKIKGGLSSTENEFIGLSHGCVTGKFLRMVLQALGEKQGTTLVAQDNKSCIHIAENPGRLSVRSKHIDVKLRWIQDAIEMGEFGLIWVPRCWMTADIGNQPQTYEMHRRFASELRGLQLPESRSRGSFVAFSRPQVPIYGDNWSTLCRRQREVDESDDSDHDVYWPIAFKRSRHLEWA